MQSCRLPLPAKAALSVAHRIWILNSLRTAKITGNFSAFPAFLPLLQRAGAKFPHCFRALSGIPCSMEKQGISNAEQGISP
jgi:hypothetical protein